jgi:signal transduction histidine kinase
MPPQLWDFGSAFAWWSDVPCYWLHALLIPAASLALLLRLRSADGEERHQIKWVAYAGAITALGWLLSYADELPWPLSLPEQSGAVAASGGDLLWLLGINILAPVAAGIAVLRYRLYEIDEVINRTVLVAGLAAFITGVYLTVVIGVGSAVHSGFGSVLGLTAAAIAAVGFAPVRARLQALANRLVHGARATPYEVLTDFADRLGSAYADEDVPALMAGLLGEGIGCRRAEVWLRVGPVLRLAAVWPVQNRTGAALPVSGEELPAALAGDGALAVRDRGELLGALRVWKRLGERFAPNESKLLADLAQQAGLILRTLRLIAELRASRERVVGALDEERRRLERNLHDGAQQRLVTASVALGLAQVELARRSAGDAERSVAEAAEQLRLGLVELRDLAQGIHPALLREAGLAVAIESLADGSPLTVFLELGLPARLPAPVETSVYFFVSEALTNAAKHARASTVTVRASEADRQLRVEVTDDGVGGADPARGSGLRGLEDRVVALGGRLDVISPRGGGTTLVAELPCA